MGPPPKAISAKIEHSDGKLRAEISVTKLDDSEDKVVFECSTNGEQYQNLVNGQRLRGRATWKGEELVIESWMEIGTRAVHFCDCWSLSPDRKTLIMEHRNDDLAGQITFFDRAG
jgi:hypothetical protein